jgi:hypothetical protein
MSVGSIWAVGNVWEFWEAWGRRAVERRFADLPYTWGRFADLPCTCRQICPPTLHFAGRIRRPTLHLLQIC